MINKFQFSFVALLYYINNWNKPDKWITSENTCAEFKRKSFSFIKTTKPNFLNMPP